jgi:hypothetical protein
MVEVLHQMRTKEGRLTEDQKRQLAEFGEALSEWTGETPE